MEKMICPCCGSDLNSLGNCLPCGYRGNGCDGTYVTEIEDELMPPSEEADHVIADLMNILSDPTAIDISSDAHLKLKDAVNVYLLERGFMASQLAALWSGEIQLTSS